MNDDTDGDDDSDNALAVVSSEDLASVSTRSPDAYEAQYMQGQGTVLYRA
ncbi:MAG: hypothetical protein JKY37_24400, partial [Nannocystaceae bacterium]|nr:hypothetical protein [Nannocystaceae bacterium]